MQSRLTRKPGDASVLATAIESRHPDPYRAVDRDVLLREAERVDSLGAGDRSVLAVELMRLIASLGPRNGHSAIDPLGGHPTPLYAYPLWLHEFDDGVFVVDAERSDLIGGELVAVEGADIDDVLRAMTPLIAHDNEWTIRARRPSFVVNATVLHGLGLVANQHRATFRVRSRHNDVVDVALQAIATGDFLARLAGDGISERLGPAYLRRRRELHWAELTGDGRALHIGYNLTLGDVSGFAQEVVALADSPRIGLIILDLRLNGGGDNRTYGPLLEALTRLGNETPLAVLISRVTFSAAMQLAVDLERNTQAVFVGEPTGGSPNQYGDAIAVELPNSGLSAFVATIAWMSAGESDERLTREPDIRVRHDSNVFFAGDDPTLDAALAALS